jgi:DNA-binding CsgD family transcriptional regulator
MTKDVLALLKRMPFSYLGITFVISWVYVVFYTPALSPFNSLDINTINIYRSCNLVASLTAFLLLIVFQNRLGEICLKPKVQIITSVLSTICTLLIALLPSDMPLSLVLGIIICATASVCSTPMYVAWGHFYGLPFNRDSKTILPVASALSMILCLICLFLVGFGLTIIAALLPLLSFASYRRAIAVSVPVADDIKKVETEPYGKFPWRITFVLAIFWFIFTFMNVYTSSYGSVDHEILYGWGFISGLAGSVFVIFQFASPKRHTTFSSVFKATIPLLLVAAILLLLLPSQSIIIVHSICLMAMTILNIHLLIFGAVFVRKNILSSTTSFAGMRIFASAGESLALIAFYRANPAVDSLSLATALVVMIAALVCVLLLAMTDTNIDNFHDNRNIKYHSLVFSAEESAQSKISNFDEDRIRAMAAFEMHCHDIAKTYELSARETEVLILFGRGRDLPYICERLYISKPTVNTHIRHIYAKIGIHSKQELLDLLEHLDSLADDTVHKVGVSNA